MYLRTIDYTIPEDLVYSAEEVAIEYKGELLKILAGLMAAYRLKKLYPNDPDSEAVLPDHGPDSIMSDVRTIVGILGDADDEEIFQEVYGLMDEMDDPMGWRMRNGMYYFPLHPLDTH